MPAALPFSTEISQASQGKTDFRVLRVKYGNGYEQRVADGINVARQSWEVSWEGLTSTNFTSLVNSIETSQGVDYFTWTPPGYASSKKFIIASYSVSASAGAVYTVSASLEQVFDIT